MVVFPHIGSLLARHLLSERGADTSVHCCHSHTVP